MSCENRSDNVPRFGRGFDIFDQVEMLIFDDAFVRQELKSTTRSQNSRPNMMIGIACTSQRLPQR